MPTLDIPLFSLHMQLKKKVKTDWDFAQAELTEDLLCSAD